jgi:hypothetical protein
MKFNNNSFEKIKSGVKGVVAAGVITAATLIPKDANAQEVSKDAGLKSNTESSNVSLEMSDAFILGQVNDREKQWKRHEKGNKSPESSHSITVVALSDLEKTATPFANNDKAMALSISDYLSSKFADLEIKDRSLPSLATAGKEEKSYERPYYFVVEKTKTDTTHSEFVVKLAFLDKVETLTSIKVPNIDNDTPENEQAFNKIVTALLNKVQEKIAQLGLVQVKNTQH